MSTDNLPAIREHSVGELEAMAKHVSRSRMFNMDEAQAFTLMLLCQAKGLHPIQATERYHIIQGRPSMRADAMQAEFQSRGGVVRWVRTDADICTAEFSHPGTHPDPVAITVRFADLEASGVTNEWNEKKQQYQIKAVYKRFPAQMLRARVTSQGVRMILPGVVAGIYTPEEVADFHDRPPDRQLGRQQHQAEALPAPEAQPESERTPRPDNRPWRKFAADGVEATNRKFREAYPGAKDVLNGFELNRHMLKAAVADGKLTPVEDPGKLKNGPLGIMLNDLDKVDREWMRSECRSYLRRRLADAHEAAALEDAPGPEVVIDVEASDGEVFDQVEGRGEAWDGPGEVEAEEALSNGA